MLVITAPKVDVSPEILRGKARDTLPLTWEERRWSRKRVTTAGGREVALALPTGTVLEPGAVILVEADWYVTVEGRPEPVLAVTPRDCAEAVRIAFDIGNRHFPLALDAERLLVPDDSAMEQLLSRLGARWERRQAVFEPFGTGHRHADGASPVEGDTRLDSRQRRG
jgi:urease accessory protein